MPGPINQLNERTLESLFLAHFTGLCQFAVGYVKDHEVAKEIVQDAFVNLWVKRNTIDLSKPVKSYLSTTVRNRCLNYLRDHQKFSSDLLALENLSAETIYDQPDKLVEADIHAQITRAIEELPGKCREIFKLSRNQNLKYQQIADELQISVKTVETQMSKALQHMRLRLAEYLPVLVISLLPFYHFTFYILPFAFCTLHFAFCILPFFMPASG
jgi:RNA polymerase sigma-70 factor (ECF subfamily)